MGKKYLIEPLRERCYYICNDEFIYYFDSRLLVIDPSEMHLDDKEDCHEPVVYNIIEGGTLIRQENFYYGRGNDKFSAFDFSNNKEIREKVLRIAFSSCMEEEFKKEKPVSYWVSKTMYKLGRMGLADASNFKEDLEVCIQKMVVSDPSLKEYVDID